MVESTDVQHAIPASVFDEIDVRLNRIQEEEKVHFLLAIESGSRAWGFPSPDSDFDVRFVYLRRREDYLSLKPPRDVIEQPILDEIDLNGWDIRKALGLMLKQNAVLSEWIESAIQYRPHDPAIAELAALVDRFFDPQGYARHYASLGSNQIKRWHDSGQGVTVKKYFYALRPALSVRALRMNADRRPPMQLQDLMEVTDLAHSLTEEIREMVAIKARTREGGSAQPRPAIDSFIISELDRCQEVPARPAGEEFAREANAFFLKLVDAYITPTAPRAMPHARP